MPERFPASDFDPWAETYDQDVARSDRFPFVGYERVLARTLEIAQAQAAMTVLDLGCGTGNLAQRFAALGCKLFCTDFSAPMLARARAKLPGAHFHLHDLQRPLPAELERGYDRIVSAYVFHHFELPQKVELCRTLSAHLHPGGRLVIADLSFPDLAAMRSFAAVNADLWEDEYYWLANDSLAALDSAGLVAAYEQVSPCAGIYSMSRPGSQEA